MTSHRPIDPDDPDVYVTVSAFAETSDDVAQAIAWIDVEVDDAQAVAVRAARAEADALRAGGE